MVRHLDGTAQVSGYEKAGATVIKGQARLAGPGRVEAAGRLLQADHVVIATGSAPVRPPVEGLDQVPAWTNREATTVRDIPARVLLIGGSAIGVELGTFYARMGAAVTIIQRAGRLIDRVDPRVSALAEQALAADGVTVRAGRTVTRAGQTPAGTVVTLDDGSRVETDVVILAAGRRPSTEGLGLPGLSATVAVRPLSIPDGRWRHTPATAVTPFLRVRLVTGGSFA